MTLILSVIGLIVHLVSLNLKVGTATIITENTRFNEANVPVPDVTICVKDGYYNKLRYENGSQKSMAVFKHMNNRSNQFLLAVPSISQSTYTTEQIKFLLESAQWSNHKAHKRITNEAELLERCIIFGYQCNILDYQNINSVGASACVYFSLQDMQANLTGKKMYPISFFFRAILPAKNILTSPSVIHLYIHQPGTYPDYMNRFRLENKDSLVIYLTTYKFNYYSRPTFTCRNNLPDIQVKMANGKLKSFAYSEALCQARLFQARVLTQCQCFSELVPSAVDDSVASENILNSRGCHDLPAAFFDRNWSLDDKRLEPYVKRYICHEQEYRNFSNTMKSSCPKQCRVTTYETTISRTSLVHMQTSTSRLPKLIEQARITHPKQIQTVWDSLYRYQKARNRTGMFFSSRMQAAIQLDGEAFQLKQEALDSTSVVAGMCGSVIGLWFGASVISACEFLEFAFSYFIKKCSTKRKEGDQTEQQH